MNICAVIVAGGRSSRMGREKASSFIRGRMILERVVSRIAGQVTEVVLNTNGDGERFKSLGLAIIRDARTDIGTPLAGLHAALLHASRNGFATVLTVPSDSPFLPADLVERLAAARHAAAIAVSAGQPHYLTGLWSAALLDQLERALIARPLPRLQDWARQCDAAQVAWPAVPFDPFFNVNTPEELAEAEQIAAEFGL